MEELLLVGLVRDFADRVAPGDVEVTDRAADIALDAFAGGASFCEALCEGQRFVWSWAGHPSHLQPVPERTLRLVS